MGLFAFRRDYVKTATANLQKLADTKHAGSATDAQREEPAFEAAPYQVVEDKKQPVVAAAKKAPRRKPRAKANPDQVVLTPDTTQKEA